MSFSITDYMSFSMHDLGCTTEGTYQRLQQYVCEVHQEKCSEEVARADTELIGHCSTYVKYRVPIGRARFTVSSSSAANNENHQLLTIAEKEYEQRGSYAVHSRVLVCLEGFDPRQDHHEDVCRHKARAGGYGYCSTFSQGGGRVLVKMYCTHAYDNAHRQLS